jgi:NitT/TauT family transport system ATP-binding protein
MVDNPLPYPRDEYHPQFISLRQKLHALLSQALIPDEPAQIPSLTQPRWVACAIPNATLSATIGLLEILENEKGTANLTELSDRVDMPFTEMLLVVTAAELLGWITTPGYQVQLTEDGRKFLAANVQTRKQLLNARLRQFRLFDLILKMLNQAENHEVNEELVLSQLAIAYPHEPSRQLFRTVVNWGRYAGLFQYSSARKTLYYRAAAS